MKHLTALAVVGIGFLAYVVYFDHRRRTDAKFRKRLRREKKKVDKSVAEATTSTSGPGTISGDAFLPTTEILAAMARIKDDRVPTTPEEREKYFMLQVEKGEQLCAQGPDFAVEAALAFFRALRVYPSPVELIMIFQNTVPEPIFKMVLEMMRLDVKGRVEGYYEAFPPNRMGVSTKTVAVTDSSGGKALKRILVADKDFTAGEIMYDIDEGAALKPDRDPLASAYCSKECEARLKAESPTLLFGPEHAIPSELNPNQDSESAKKREDAQAAFDLFVRESGGMQVMLVARFIARQVVNETVKLLPRDHPSAPKPQAGDPEADGGGWTEKGHTLFDHMERVRYLKLSGKEGGTEQLRAILSANLPGLDDLYNAYGVSYSGGRDDKPPSTAGRRMSS
ncbi:hypothetical protein F5148DRAFT_1372359 [Russula earlei]|uniref:Uncharacterized protein n=1 Tax=Russula earlei TaxID=71964 RepID=A0ACC0TQ82_9AGAM|nr:hypothetical protein F5148DRAFT_1372359 [Russula earlei]